MRRSRVPVLITAGVVALMCAGGANVFAQPVAGKPTSPGGPGSLAGTWYNADYWASARLSEHERVLHTVDGKLPPLRPDAAQLLEQRIHESEQGEPFANTQSQCLPGGIPEELFGADYPVQILETPGQVSMLFEEMNHYRLIYLNDTHPKDVDPSYMGDAVAHWDGDTLVVDTIGLTERTSLDELGMPHSDALHLIERYRRVAPDTLQVRVTIDDPKIFTAAWDAQRTYKLVKPGTKLHEYICENNRNAPDAQGNVTFQKGK